MTGFETAYPVTFLVEQIRGDFHRQLGNDLGRPFLARFFADQSQDGEGQRLDAPYRAEAGTARAGLVRRFANGWPQALTRHFQQAEAADLANLHSGTILANRFT